MVDSPFFRAATRQAEIEKILTNQMKITQKDLSSFVPCLRQPGTKTLLHIGCGTAPKSRLPECFKSEYWREVRLDIDPKVKPDIVASVTNMSAVPSATADAVWSSHNLEHLESYEVSKALSEIQRVLKPGGFVLINLPNLQQVAELVASGKSDEVLYTSPAGPITPLDMMFGHQASLARGNYYMAHRTGYTQDRLHKLLVQAGFSEVRVTRGSSYDLWAVATVGINPQV